MKCTIIYSVLDSQDVLTRQILHLSKIVPNDWEVVIMDDGSSPALTIPENTGLNVRLIKTLNFTPWTQMLARDWAAFRYSSGEYLFMSDIDHILTKEAITSIKNFNGDMMKFPRNYGVLNEKGELVRDAETLVSYGSSLENLNWVGKHENTFSIKASTFREKLNGYSKYFYGRYPGDDQDLIDRYASLVQQGIVSEVVDGAMIHVFPDPSKDVRKMFHSASRD